MDKNIAIQIAQAVQACTEMALRRVRKEIRTGV